MGHVATAIDTLNLKLVLHMTGTAIKTFGLLHPNFHATLRGSIQIVTTKHTSGCGYSLTIDTLCLFREFRAINGDGYISIHHSLNG